MPKGVKANAAPANNDEGEASEDEADVDQESDAEHCVIEVASKQPRRNWRSKHKRRRPDGTIELFYLQQGEIIDVPLPAHHASRVRQSSAQISEIADKMVNQAKDVLSEPAPQDILERSMLKTAASSLIRYFADGNAARLWARHANPWTQALLGKPVIDIRDILSLPRATIEQLLEQGVYITINTEPDGSDPEVYVGSAIGPDGLGGRLKGYDMGAEGSESQRLKNGRHLASACRPGRIFHVRIFASFPREVSPKVPRLFEALAMRWLSTLDFGAKYYHESRTMAALTLAQEAVPAAMTNVP